jgi:predicted MFS family arabinose efflux permease
MKASSSLGGRAHGLAPLRRPDYFKYLVGNGVSAAGSQAEIVAASWLLYQLTDSPLLLGLGGLFQALPIFLLVPYAGTMADRCSPRRILIAAQCLGAANSLALGLLTAAGWVEPWHVYLQALLQAGGAAFDVTARQALFPRLVPRQELDQAVALNFAAVRVAMLSGPSAGGWIAAYWGSAPVFFLNAASYLAMLAAVLAIREPQADRSSSTERPAREEMLRGFVFVARSPALATLLLLASLWGLLSYNPALLTIFARDVLDAGPRGLGILMSSGAIGQLAGSLALVGWGAARSRKNLLLGMGVLYTTAMAAFSFSRFFYLSAALVAVAAVAHAVFSATRHTILQRAAPDSMRGRVMGIHLLVTRGASPLSQMLSGVLVHWLGPAAALLTATLLVGGATALLAARNRSLDGDLPSS